MTPEPFGYFRPEPFGWTDCAETDEDARPLYDHEAVDALVAEIETERCLSFRNQVAELEKQRDELLAAVEPLIELCDQLCRWDRRFDDALDVVDAAIARAKETK